MRPARARWVVWLVLPGLLLAGCWDRREIEERSTVLAAGVDPCSEGEDCKVKVTRQIAIPGRIPLGAEGGGESPRNTVDVVTNPGRDIIEATGLLQAELNRQINVGHTRLLVFGEALARQGLEETLDYSRRIPDLRRLMWIAVSDGSAEQVIRARPSLERLPALFLNDMFEDAVRSGRLPEVFLGEFMVRTANKGEDATAPILKMEGPDQPALAGLAVFRKATMVGKLSPDETVTYMELRGLRKGAELLPVDLPGGGHGDLSVYGRKVHYSLGWVQGRVQATIRLQMESNLVQLSPELVSSDAATIQALEREASRLVTRRSVSLVRKLQQDYNADVLALGERVRALMPAVWRQVGTDWHRAFPRAQFRFDVQVNIRRSGMAMD